MDVARNIAAIVMGGALGRRPCRINTIVPGLFATPPMPAVPKDVTDGLAACVPFPRRLGRPEEFALFVPELVREGCFGGQAIRLVDGMRMPPR